jgi:hypothetical protein
VPARLVAFWNGKGTSTPFTTLDSTGFVLNLANANYSYGYIFVGQEPIDIKNLPSSPQITAMPPPANNTGLTAVFLPLFAIGDTLKDVSVYNTWGTLETSLAGTALTTAPLTRLSARGTYDRATNTFTAETINFLN